VGRAIRVATAGTGKKLSLELGGKSPFIVFDDADLDSAVEGVVDAIWFNQGQVCCAGSRLLVQESVAHRFHEKLKVRASKLRVGDPLDKSTDVGAIVSAVQLKRIESLVAQGCAEGGECWQAEHALPSRGFFFPPTLFTGVAPAATIAQEEIFGPVLVSTTFRTHDEALTLANNSRYGLAASIWSENINVALDAASRVKAGVVWINSTNLFDAAAGFGGYRESGFGREGGREGLYEYLKLRVAAEKLSHVTSLVAPTPAVAPIAASEVTTRSPMLDHTAKLYIGGKQTRPDGGNSYTVFSATGKPLGQAGLGNRKDIRNAVEAAHAASGWSSYTAHNRAQVLFFLAENLEQRSDEFAQRLHALLGGSLAQSKTEVAQSVSRVMYYAAYADKYDGAVHATRTRNVTLAMPEPFGVMGIVCPTEAPLLSMISLVMPAISMGNRVVVVPSTTRALIVTDFYQVLETSDVPSGVINIVTGEHDMLAKTMAEHDDINALWYHGNAEGSAMVERASSGNLKPTWVNSHSRDWRPAANQGREFLQKATQIKNIWVPYGE
jgi:aldehyde dehydrogenase (NAD+)